MAYKRRIRRRFIRRRKPTMKRTGAKKLAKRAIRMVKKLSPEVKYSESYLITSQFNYTPSSSYLFSPFTAISQGLTDHDARIGDKISVFKHIARMAIYNTSGHARTVRIVCIQIKQNSETLISMTNLGQMYFESSLTGSGQMINATQDYDNRHNWRVLYDKLHLIEPKSGSVAAPANAMKTLHITLKPNRDIQYFHGGTGLQSITKNELVWMLLADVVASSSLYVNGVFRTLYTDA